MAVVQVHELRGMTQEQYEAAWRELDMPGPPPGSLCHVGGPMEGGWRIIEVWESEEAAAAFFGSERFQQMAQRVGAPQPNTTTWPVHTVRK